jgi:hypothetical protein
MSEPAFVKLGIYIKASEPILTAFFINPASHPRVSPIVARQVLDKIVTAASPIVARQLLDKIVTAATNKHATIELLGTSFSFRIKGN